MAKIPKMKAVDDFEKTKRRCSVMFILFVILALFGLALAYALITIWLL
jgi:hypothetical protein